MLAHVTHILPITTIRRERTLPVPGKVVVRKGQKVGPTDVIAETKIAPEQMLLDISRGLGLPPHDADELLQFKAGAAVAQGDVLAGPVGISRRVVRAPSNGRIIVAGEGQVLLELESPPYELKAGMPGIISELIDDLGVIVETSGSLIQGVWGNGRVDFGLLLVLARAPDEPLKADRLDVSLRGSVVLAGSCDDPQVIKTAGELPLRGLILGSMDGQLLPTAAKARYPIIVLDGFGRRGINTAAYRLLSTSERREVTLNAEPWDRFTGYRPEVIIPLPASPETSATRETADFAPGQRVICLRAPYTGLIGTLVSLLPGLHALPNGVKTIVAEIDLEEGDRVVLPLANMNVLV
jgi:hypothetical protein